MKTRKKQIIIFLALLSLFINIVMITSYVGTKRALLDGIYDDLIGLNQAIGIYLEEDYNMAPYENLALDVRCYKLESKIKALSEMKIIGQYEELGILSNVKIAIKEKRVNTKEVEENLKETIKSMSKEQKYDYKDKYSNVRGRMNYRYGANNVIKALNRFIEENSGKEDKYGF